jgi:hypothetical protein
MNLPTLIAMTPGNDSLFYAANVTRLVLMIVLPLVIIQLVLLITALVSLVKKQVRGGDKALWAVIIIFVNIIGPIIYFAVGSNMLDQKAAQLEENEEENYP